MFQRRIFAVNIIGKDHDKQKFDYLKWNMETRISHMHIRLLFMGRQTIIFNLSYGASVRQHITML